MTNKFEAETKEIELTDLYFDYVLDNDYDAVVQVGGRFSGKSQNEQIRLVSNLANKENYKLLVIEDLETGMSEGFHAGLYARIREFKHDSAYTPETKVAHIKNVINNNQCIFRGYSSEQQKLNVKKLSGITEILVEEGEWMTRNDFISLFQQLRGGSEKDRKLTVLLNPVDEDCFVNSDLIQTTPDRVFKYFDDEPDRPKVFEKSICTKFDMEGEEIEVKIRVLVVISTHFDNQFLTNEQRASIEQYKETDPELYEQLGRAKFIMPKGAYFREFDKGIHVISPFPIPSDWKRYSAIDYGLDMFAVLFFAIDRYGNAYVYKIIHESDLIISKASLRYKQIKGDDNIEIAYAPPDLWNRRQETGKSAVEIFAKNGISLVKSRNDRVNGWYAVKEWMNVYSTVCEQTGKPIKASRLRIFNTCDALIDNIPKAMKDERNPNDVANEPHEITHILDALRYFLCMRTKPYPRTKARDDEFGLNKIRRVSRNEISSDYINY